MKLKSIISIIVVVCLVILIAIYFMAKPSSSTANSTTHNTQVLTSNTTLTGEFISHPGQSNSETSPVTLQGSTSFNN